MDLKRFLAALLLLQPSCTTWAAVLLSLRGSELCPSPEPLHFLLLRVVLLESNFSPQQLAKLWEAFLLLFLPSCLALSEGLGDLGETFTERI